MEIVSAVEGGLVARWDEYEQLLTYTLRNMLGVKTEEHPVLLAEPSFNTRAQRERQTELLMEKLQVPALFVSKAAVLSAFSNGRATALVLDLGAGQASAVPVQEGYVLQRALLRSSLAGERLQDMLLEHLRQRQFELRPPYEFQRHEVVPGRFEVRERPEATSWHTTESYRRWTLRELARDIKESVLRVSETPFSDEQQQGVPQPSYELPDGRLLDLGLERFRIPETLFRPAPGAQSPEPSLPQMVWRAVQACDADLRRDLLQSIVVTGGTSLLTGLTERLSRELHELAPQRCRLIAPNFSAERRFSPWIGGSILASLGSFQQMWISKQEYEEHGRSIVEKKCP
jgi:actin-related protein